MATTFFPAILYPVDADDLFGVEVLGININASGDTQEGALADAAGMLQDVVDDLSAAGEAIPSPVAVGALDLMGGTLAMIPANLPSKTVRINVTLPDHLVQRIDAIAPNRSAFLAQSALERLRDL